VSFTTVLAFPRDSMSFTVHCQLVVYHCRWLHSRHGVWVRVVVLVPYGTVFPFRGKYSLLKNSDNCRPLTLKVPAADCSITGRQPFQAYNNNSLLISICNYIKHDWNLLLSLYRLPHTYLHQIAWQTLAISLSNYLHCK
jgi:hypothetical protein